MKLFEAIEKLGAQKSEEIAERASCSLDIPWDEVKVVFRVCLNDFERCPADIKSKNGSPEKLILKWVEKYKKGYDNRPSKSIGKPPQTFPDDIIDEIIRARISFLTQNHIIEIKFAHRLSMSVENILGLLLEEYLATKLKQYGWICAWGQTLKSVDLCHVAGKLLQVKNRSNTENSSSNKVRNGTEIEIWWRVDAKTGKHCWQDLQDIVNANVDELDFRKFIIETISKNPEILGLDEDSPWGN